MIVVDIPEEQHKEMRSNQLRTFTEKAAAELYFCALKHREDGVPWPRRLDEAHRLLWEELGREEVFRRELVGPVGDD